MGIREHLKKHPEETKLQDLSLETEQSESGSFDVRELISEQTWQRILKDLKKFLEPCKDLEFMHLAANIKLIFPERVEQLQLDQIQEYHQESFHEVIKDEFYRRDDFQVAFWIEYVMEFRILYPDYWEEPEWEDKIREEMKNSANLKYANKDFLQCADYLSMYKIRFGMLETSYPLDTIFERLNVKLDQLSASQDLSAYCKCLAVLRILFPDKFQQLTHKIAWEQIRDYLENLSLETDDDLNHFIVSLKNVKIIAAENIQITGQGLEISEELMAPSDFKQTKKSRPERKKF